MGTGAKRPGREASHSFPSSTMVTNAGPLLALASVSEGTVRNYVSKRTTFSCWFCSADAGA
jgi:hypothetical protein